MKVQIFTIPILGGDEENQRMNNFLGSHRIIDIQQSMVADMYWTFCIRYLDSTPSEGKERSEAKSKVDYRELLTAEQFARYATMRMVRKQLSETKAIPAFTIFTNEELAAISRIEKPTLEDIKSIPNVGARRAEEYGNLLIEAIQKEEENETI